MPLSEDIRGISSLNKARKFIPSFGKSHTKKAIKIITVVIINVINVIFFCLKLLLSELSVPFTLSLFLPFSLKTGSNIQAINKIKIIKNNTDH